MSVACEDGALATRQFGVHPSLIQNVLLHESASMECLFPLEEAHAVNKDALALSSARISAETDAAKTNLVELIKSRVSARNGCLIWPYEDIGSCSVEACVSWIGKTLVPQNMHSIAVGECNCVFSLWIKSIWTCFTEHYKMWANHDEVPSTGATAVVCIEALLLLTSNCGRFFSPKDARNIRGWVSDALANVGTAQFIASEISLADSIPLQAGKDKSPHEKKLPPPPRERAELPGTAVRSFRIQHALKLPLLGKVMRAETEHFDAKDPWKSSTFANLVNRGGCLDERVYSGMVRLLLSLLIRPWDRSLDPRHVHLTGALQGHAFKMSRTETMKTTLSRIHFNCKRSMPLGAILLRLLIPENAEGTTIRMRCGSLGDRIASGRFGLVYRCRGQIGAVAKVISISHSGNGGSRGGLSSIFREVAMLSASQGNGVAHLLDFGVVVESGERSVWIVMPEYGPSLALWRRSLDEKGNGESLFMLPAMLAQFISLCDATSHLHAAKIIHCDIRGDNVLMTKPFFEAVCQKSHIEYIDAFLRGGTCLPSPVVLADFGVSVLVDDATPFMNDTCRSAQGAECIQAPEILQSRNATHRGCPSSILGASDVWSLGCILFEIVSNSHLYDSEVQLNWPKFFARITDVGADALPLIPDDGERKWKEYFELPCVDLKPHARPILSSIVKELIECALQRDPGLRPSAKALGERARLAHAEVNAAFLPSSIVSCENK